MRKRCWRVGEGPGRGLAGPLHGVRGGAGWRRRYLTHLRRRVAWNVPCARAGPFGPRNRVKVLEPAPYSGRLAAHLRAPWPTVRPRLRPLSRGPAREDPRSRAVRDCTEPGRALGARIRERRDRASISTIPPNPGSRCTRTTTLPPRRRARRPGDLHRKASTHVASPRAPIVPTKSRMLPSRTSRDAATRAGSSWTRRASPTFVIRQWPSIPRASSARRSSTSR